MAGSLLMNILNLIDCHVSAFPASIKGFSAAANFRFDFCPLLLKILYSSYILRFPLYVRRPRRIIHLSIMERFFEANRVVESSLFKLNNSSREMPLRKALLVSKAMNRAQEVADISLLNCGTSRSSSKLLASMQSASVEEDTLVEIESAGAHRPNSAFTRAKPISPMALTQCSAVKEQEDDVMEFISNSVLSDILCDENMDDCVSSNSPSCYLSPALPTRQWTPSPLSDLSNKDWPSWTTDSWSPLQKSHTRDISSPPLSPGKRHRHTAFPCEENVDQSEQDDIKRLKLSETSACTNIFSSLPGFCDYLSPRLYTSPLITYMFGRGLDTSSNEHSISDWPSLFVHADNSVDYSSNVSSSSSNFFPVLAY